MSGAFLIIDGYNLMHACGMAKQDYAPGELERRRQWFLNHVTSRMTAPELARATLVFDAFSAPPDAPRRFRYRGLRIVFAPAGGDADTQIEELVAQHSAPKQVLVISSDHRLQRAARRRRGQFASSEQFAALLARREPRLRDQSEETPRPLEDEPSVGHPKFDGEVSADETIEWLDYFRDLELPAAVESLSADVGVPAPSARAVPAQPAPEAVPSEQPALREKTLSDEFDDDDVSSWLEVFGEVLNADELQQLPVEKTQATNETAIDPAAAPLPADAEQTIPKPPVARKSPASRQRGVRDLNEAGVEESGDWLKIFGEVDVAEVSKQIAPGRTPPSKTPRTLDEQLDAIDYGVDFVFEKHSRRKKSDSP